MVPVITYIFVKITWKFFEEFIRNTRTDRYNLMCPIDAHEKNPSVHNYGNSGGGYPILLSSTTEALVSISATIDFIGCCLQALDKTFARTLWYVCFCNVKLFFRKSQLNFLNHQVHRKNTNY